MIQVTEPQVWTLIGVFSASLLAMMTLMSTMFLNVVRSEIGGLRREMDAKFDRMETKFAAKFDALDRDIQMLIRHTFPEAQ